MKRFIVITLMLLFAVLAGMVPLRPGFRHLAREVMREHLAFVRAGQQQEQAVIIAEADIPEDAWEEESEEFRLNGKLYDVLDTIHQQGKKYYRCLADELELQAEQEADNIAQGIAHTPRTPQGKLAKALSDWLSHLFWEAPVQKQMMPVARKGKCLSAVSTGVLPQTYLSGIVRPPEMLQVDYC